MLTKCADSHSGSRADNEKHIGGKARRDGGGGGSRMNFGWSRSKFPTPLLPPFPFREIYILSMQKYLSSMFFIKFT